MLRLTSTLTGGKSDFTPGDPSNVLMYVCGVTPYAESHVGHGMSYVIFDVVRRYLAFSGYGVRLVQNFTDIDDKIIARSQELGDHHGRAGGPVHAALPGGYAAAQRAVRRMNIRLPRRKRRPWCG